MSEDIRYIINKDKGVVVCILSGCTYIGFDRLRKYFPKYSLCDNFEIKDEYVGVAKCAPEDVWDEEYGKKLAFFKARKKRNKAINNMLGEHVKIIERQLDDLKKYGIHKTPEWEE